MIGNSARSILKPMRFVGSILRKSRPIQLTFFVTAKCNSRCPFCFYLQGKNGKIDASKELSLEEIEKVSASMGSLIWLLYSGGEPYLRDDLVEVCRVFYENNRPWIITIPTNGLMPGKIVGMTREILDYCSESVVAVKLSLDGLREGHDALRGVEGNFEKVMETYYRLTPLLDEHPNFELGINTVFCKANQDNIIEIVDFVRGLNKIRTHTLSLIRGDLRDDSYKQVDLNLYHSIINEMEKNIKRRESNIYSFPGARLKAAQDVLQRRLIYETMKRKRRLIPCYAGRLNLVLTEKGDVYPCELFKGKMGNVREYDYDIAKLLETDEAKKVISEVKDGGCYCSHECYFMTNILFNPGNYGKLIREYLSLLL